MATALIFLAEHAIHVVEGRLHTDCLPILQLFVRFIGSPDRVTNPYLRGKLTEALCALAPITTAHGQGTTRMTTVMSEDPVLVSQAVPSVLGLYVQIEHTGTTSQFYDKFNVSDNRHRSVFPSRPIDCRLLYRSGTSSSLYSTGCCLTQRIVSAWTISCNANSAEIICLC